MELFEVSYFSKGESDRKRVIVRSISLVGAIIRVFEEKVGTEEQNVINVSAKRIEMDYLD